LPAKGPVVEVLVLWIDSEGKRHKVRAQDWVQEARTKKAMTYDWVFAGSGFSVDEQTGERYYHADGGDMICVSNFSTAMLDLPVQSSQVNAELMFVAFTERIPPLGTKVRLVLIPKLDEKKPAVPRPAEPQTPADPAAPAKTAAGDGAGS
jgi:hypothetical protein